MNNGIALTGSATTTRTSERMQEERRVKRVVIADPLSSEGLDLLVDNAELEVVDVSSEGREALEEAVRDAEGLIVRSGTQVDESLLDLAERLEVIGRAGVGVDNIDMRAATRRGVAVINAPGGNTSSTAELAFALLLAAARRVAEADRSVREGRWDRKALRGRQLRGNTLGVIGAGRIGTEVARRAHAFGMRILAHDPYLSAERAADERLERVELDELLERADFVTVHVPRTEQTRGMIGVAEIARMKPTAILINAARGGIVEERALAVALEQRKLGGAALDVYETEPLPGEHPLRGTPNLVMTPHLGAATIEAQREVALEIARRVRNALVAGDLTAALNVPQIDPEERARLEPLLELGRRLGVVLSALTDGRCQRLEVRYAGSMRRVLRLLAAASLEGYLRSTVASPLNLVNALAVADERSIDVARVRRRRIADYANYVELTATGGPREQVVGGALLEEGHRRLTRVGQFHVDAVPRGNLVLVKNRDVPGVIGEVGSCLGEAEVNIAEYHLARTEEGGEALGVIRTDAPLSTELVEELSGLPSVIAIRQVVLDG
ncbi:MAG: phosphoglycerate dehydrogenase [Gemmatimonadales bacterium]